MNSIRLAVWCALSLTVAACGGGGGGSSSVPSSPPPTGTSGGAGGGTNPPVSPDPGTDIIRGAITGFGSVFIDGHRFDTSAATFSKDDDESTQDDLSVGMVVEVRGDISSGTATSVRFEEDVKGPVDSVGANQLVVLGQTVLILPETVIDDSLNLATLVAGDILEVSGLRNGSDQLEASFIEDKQAAEVNAFKVIGRIRDLDTTAQTFRIDGLNIDYSVARLDDLAALSDDMLVEVKDENRAYSPGDFNLIATKIEPAGTGLGLPDNGAGARIQVEGLVSSITSAGEFVLAGTVVRHTGSTLFVFGDATLLAAGTKVQVEGTVAEDGSIDATKIKFARNSARIEGVVEGTNLDEGTFTVLGITIEPRSTAEWEDSLDDQPGFGLSDLSAGDFVEVRGNSTGNRVFASEIERDDLDDTRLRGPATDVDSQARALSILGVSIVTSGNTQYEGFSDEVITASAFFAALADGQTLVSAQWDGSVTDPTVAVRELSLED